MSSLRSLLSVICLAVAGFLGSQHRLSCADSTSSPLEGLEDMMKSSEITFSYTYDVSGMKVGMKGQGSVILQGESFILEVDGLEIRCDGKTRWTIDRGAEELVIEHYDSHSADLAANPALLLHNVSDLFEVSSQSVAEYSGKKATKVVLVPKSYPGLRGVTLYFRYGTDESDILIGASVESSDSVVTDFSIVDFAYGPRKDAGRFTFDVESLGREWIVTDLR